MAPAWREIARRAFDAHPLPGFDSWAATALTLWREAMYREERYAAIALIGDRSYVDDVAIHRIGGLLQTEPQAMRPIRRMWSGDPDVWKRRTSIVCQDTFKAATEEALLFSSIDEHRTEPARNRLLYPQGDWLGTS